MNIIFDVLLLAKYESVIQIWLLKRHFEENGVKDVKNDNFHDTAIVNFLKISFVPRESNINF